MHAQFITLSLKHLFCQLYGRYPCFLAWQVLNIDNLFQYVSDWNSQIGLFKTEMQLKTVNSEKEVMVLSVPVEICNVTS